MRHKVSITYAERGKDGERGGRILCDDVEVGTWVEECRPADPRWWRREYRILGAEALRAHAPRCVIRAFVPSSNGACYLEFVGAGPWSRSTQDYKDDEGREKALYRWIGEAVEWIGREVQWRLAMAERQAKARDLARQGKVDLTVKRADEVCLPRHRERDKMPGDWMEYRITAPDVATGTEKEWVMRLTIAQAMELHARLGGELLAITSPEEASQ